MAKSKTAKPKPKATPAAKRATAAKPAKPRPKTKTKTQTSRATAFDRIDPLPTIAWGLTRLSPELASSARAHALLGLGYPHMLLTTPGTFAGTDEKLRAVMRETRIVPRNAVERLYRLTSGDDAKTVTLGNAVSFALERSGNHFATFALERLFGSDATAEAFTAALEAYPTSAWTSTIEACGGTAIRGFGFVLWRIPTKTREAIVRRLTALHARLVEAELEGWRPVQALDVILNGRGGVERSLRRGAKPFFADLICAGGDPGWVRKQAIARLAGLTSADREQFTIQLGVIGGPTVTEALRRAASRFSADQKASIALQLSLCA